MENSISGKTSVCSRPWVEASRSAQVPGRADAWPANAVMPPSRPRSANSSTLVSDSARIVPQMNTVGPVDGDRAADRHLPRPPPPCGTSWKATRIVATRAPRTPSSASTGLDDVAVAPGDERLDEHADQGDAEDHEQR